MFRAFVNDIYTSNTFLSSFLLLHFIPLVFPFDDPFSFTFSISTHDSSVLRIEHKLEFYFLTRDFFLVCDIILNFSLDVFFPIPSFFFSRYPLFLFYMFLFYFVPFTVSVFLLSFSIMFHIL
uniref:Uncharacterized protein n=1 Tax=Cacopsylla melanoneura TaxID=428564 RepID=A0A8D8ZAK5_9HEMI